MKKSQGKIQVKKGQQKPGQRCLNKYSGRTEARGGNQSRHPEKERSSPREGQAYWLGQKLMQEAEDEGNEYITGHEILSWVTMKVLPFLLGEKGSHLPEPLNRGVM